MDLVISLASKLPSETEIFCAECCAPQVSSCNWKWKKEASAGNATPSQGHRSRPFIPTCTHGRHAVTETRSCAGSCPVARKTRRGAISRPDRRIRSEQGRQIGSSLRRDAGWKAARSDVCPCLLPSPVPSLVQ